MIEINKKLNNERNPDVVTMLRRKVEAIDGEIDRLVCLKPAVGIGCMVTKEEIKIVEGD